MKPTYALVLFASTAGLLLTACGASRTTPYHPVEGEFDPQASDERALELVEAMMAELGTPGAWDEVKQLRWQQIFFLEDEVRGLFVHAWDRWNARHRYEQPTLPSLALAEQEGDPDLVQSIVAKYRIYDMSRAHVSFAGMPAADDDAEEMLETARESFDHGHFMLAGYHRLQEPGVTLHYQGQSEPNSGYCEPACSIVMAELAPELGGHRYFLHINTETSRPDIIARQVGTVQQAYGLAEWTEIAGLEFPVQFENVGNAAERIVYEDLEIGDVERSLYVPEVRQAGRSR